MRPIAMRCTQEQFDSIKDRVNLPIVCMSDYFERYPYITNFYDCVFKVTNTKHPNAEQREIHETFNGDIFLEACGVEIEKVWKSREMQIRTINGEWVDVYNKNLEYRLKSQPNYDKEIEALQQKAKENGMKCIIQFEKI